MIIPVVTHYNLKRTINLTIQIRDVTYYIFGSVPARFVSQLSGTVLKTSSRED